MDSSHKVRQGGKGSAWNWTPYVVIYVCEVQEVFGVGIGAILTLKELEKFSFK